MNIHDFVDNLKEKFALDIKEYIETMFSSIITDLSLQHGISETTLNDTLQKTLSKSLKKCSVVTKLGHNCKYDAREGHSVCLKHYNIINT